MRWKKMDEQVANYFIYFLCNLLTTFSSKLAFVLAQCKLFEVLMKFQI